VQNLAVGVPSSDNVQPVKLTLSGNSSENFHELFVFANFFGSPHEAFLLMPIHWNAPLVKSLNRKNLWYAVTHEPSTNEAAG
jgi:hypothetical protein